MQIFGFNISRAPIVEEQKAALPSSRGWWPLISESFPGAWQRNIEVKATDVLSHPTAFRCVSLIATDISKLRVRLMGHTNGVLQEVTNPAFSPVLRRPNAYQNTIQFFESWMSSKLVHGNTYVLKVRDNRNVVVGMHVLDAMRVRPLVSPDGQVFYSVGSDDLANVKDELMVPASEIMHDRFNTFYHPLVGLSPITAAGLAAMQGLQIQNQSAVFFRNGSQPGGIVTAPGRISDEMAERIKATWEARFSGDQTGRLAVFGEGMTYQPRTMTAQDSQLIEQLRWTAEAVASAFGVPAYKVGVGQPPNFNNVAALNDQYYTQVLQFHIESVERLLDDGLGLFPRGLQTQFDLGQLLRMDPVAKIETAERAVGAGIWAPNEARGMFDLPPVPGGDSPYLQQQNWSLEALARRDERELVALPPPVPGDDDEPPRAGDDVRAYLTERLDDAARRRYRAAA